MHRYIPYRGVLAPVAVQWPPTDAFPFYFYGRYNKLFSDCLKYYEVVSISSALSTTHATVSLLSLWSVSNAE